MLLERLIPARVKNPLKIRGAARSQLRSLGLRVPGLRLRTTSEIDCVHEAHLVRRKGGYDALVALRGPAVARTPLSHMLATYVHWFDRADPRISRIAVDCSDGEWPGGARFTYSTTSDAVIPVPDAHFFRARGYADTDRAAEGAPDWDDREDDIIWRGGLNNLGFLSTDPAFEDHPGVMQRARLALKCKRIDGVDMRFVDSKWGARSGKLREAGLLAARIPAHHWCNRKYAIDIDGYTNAWSNLMERLKMGCCVLKIASPFGFRQWYYDRLIPWEHYVPVAADMSDLEERIDWMRSTPARAREIAAAGQALARAMTFDSEREVAAALISEHA